MVSSKDRVKLSELRTSSGFPVIYREAGSGLKWGLIDLSHQAQESLVDIIIGNGPTLSTNGTTTWWSSSTPFIRGQSLVNFEHIAGSRLKINGVSNWLGFLTGRCRFNMQTTSGISFRTRERFVFGVQVDQGASSSFIPCFETRQPAGLVPLADSSSIVEFTFAGLFNCYGEDLATANHYINLRFRVEYPGTSFDVIITELRIRLIPMSNEPIFGPADPHNPGSVGVLSGAAALDLGAPAMDSSFTFSPFLEE
jgi:hypothetical protein